ncbi:XdhC family protein [Paracraurococcus lichenis]|uniref:XdhC family protein n=1 Tax=Paracraurococcus lichenis TaxID=3064888 RepID=A0ABT9DWN8_9PROT|nr:XdhC family protein [Paracraurococcus sp. LOR1-02]MDO9708325.1 XdhC family protein [Paracraurococcus sp. LOR1-02]
MTPEVLAALQAAQAAKRPVALLTRLTDGHQCLWPETAVPGALAEAAQRALRDDAAGNVTLDGEAWFIHPHNPPLRMIVVGAVHIAQALVPMAQTLGFAVTVVDPRRAWATADRFPGITLIHEWTDDAMVALAPDARTAVLTLTHDPKLDDPALDVALKSEAFYIGALGSRRTHAKRVARLTEAGHGEAAIARIHAPVGVNIEAVTAPEIALSILAEVVAARRGAALATRATPAQAAAA